MRRAGPRKFTKLLHETLGATDDPVLPSLRAGKRRKRAAANPDALVRSQLLFGRNARRRPKEPGRYQDLIHSVAPVDSLVIDRASDVKTLPLEWLWPGRIPAGRLTLLAGDPGIGKSLLAMDIAARVSSGATWPDKPAGRREPSNVLVFSMEDDLRDTIAPRLIRAGANMDHTFVVEGVYNRPPFTVLNWKRRFRIPDDIESLGLAFRELLPVRLVVFDPLAAYCGTASGGGLVHSLLWPLVDLAARSGAAILCTTHLRAGSGTKAVHQAVGNLAFTTAARAVWTILHDPRDMARRVMVPAKANLCPETDGLAFRIEDGAIQWEKKPIALTADRAFAFERDGNKLTEAEELLRAVLAEGAAPWREIWRQARECGISKTTLHRASENLGGVRQR